MKYANLVRSQLAERADWLAEELHKYGPATDRPLLEEYGEAQAAMKAIGCWEDYCEPRGLDPGHQPTDCYGPD